MKNAILIIGALALLCVGALVYVSLYLFKEKEYEKASKQTEAARAARWKKNEVEPKTEIENENLKVVSDPV